jgi:leader peptidase (prepilin peptidase)/N-methyltransferase
MIEVLQQTPWLFFTTVFLVSLLVGSFLNVVIYRLPVMMEREWNAQLDAYDAERSGREPAPPPAERFNLVLPRSRCPQCGHGIRAVENLPVVSYLFLRGRCSECGARISPRYPLIELATAIASLVVALRFGFGIEAVAGIVFTWALIALSMIDVDHQLLPDAITLPLLWLGLLLSLFTVNSASVLFIGPEAAIVGAAAGYLVLWSVYHLFRLLTGKEGMGYGDFKLLAAIGAWLGWEVLPMVVFLSALVGAVIGIAQIVFGGRTREQPIPYGPYLAAAGWIAMLWGQQLTDLYTRTLIG